MATQTIASGWTIDGATVTATGNSIAINLAKANTWTETVSITPSTTNSSGVIITNNGTSGNAGLRLASTAAASGYLLSLENSSGPLMQTFLTTGPYVVTNIANNTIYSYTTNNGFDCFLINSTPGLSTGYVANAISTLYNTLDDGSGNMTVAGWAYIKGKNRSYQQDLTASTTTSTTATLLGTSISFTPKFSGYLVVSLTVRANNNTVGDGVTIGLYQGASSGALTTKLDGETYTQEGLASNSETFVLHYELSSQTVGTATYISAAFNAVTGGTASAKIVSFSVQEI